MTASQGTLRISQHRLTPQLKAAKRATAYDPDVASDGLTVDTPSGPVDLVAVERVQEGRLTPVTLADVRYAVAQLPDGLANRVEPLAAGLGITRDGVERAYERHKQAVRIQAESAA